MESLRSFTKRYSAPKNRLWRLRERISNEGTSTEPFLEDRIVFVPTVSGPGTEENKGFIAYVYGSVRGVPGNVMS